MNDDPSRPIGVFDSGVGGLTVLKALQARLPGEDFVYLGDTARLPYGTKSPTSVVRYARQATRRLLDEDVKLLVIACNTASAVALEALATATAPLPVVGVVEPGALAATGARPEGAHLVLATEATVRLGAYGRAITALDPAAEVRELPCELLVALAEEGWVDGAIAESIVRRYLDSVVFRPDSVILGCTHFPLLADTIRACLEPAVSVVDSAVTTADVVADALESRGLSRSGTAGDLRFLATDGAMRFARVGGRFLGRTLTAADVELVDI